MLAIGRQGNSSDVDKLVETAFARFFELVSSDQLTWLRTLEVAFARHGAPSGATRLS